MWPFIIAGAGVLLIRELLKESGWNKNWKKKNIDSLPESPGVYIFYDKDDYIIHIGSTGNLFKRIDAHTKRRQMRNFDWKETDTKEDAYDLEMKLQDKYEYGGR